MYRLTKFEKVRIIGSRASQISRGAPSTVDITGMTEPLAIAEKEFRERKCPLVVIRKFPNGKVEKIPVCEMEYEI
tara:strand:+ start:1104 stop:1328 length:225 start_codon:yes stop_codon:yes gene_type:complete